MYLLLEDGNRSIRKGNYRRLIQAYHGTEIMIVGSAEGGSTGNDRSPADRQSSLVTAILVSILVRVHVSHGVRVHDAFCMCT